MINKLLLKIATMGSGTVSPARASVFLLSILLLAEAFIVPRCNPSCSSLQSFRLPAAVYSIFR